MSSTSSLKAVIFDVDGVLINSIPTHIRAFDLVLAKYGLKLSDLKDDHRASSLRHILDCLKEEYNVDVEFEPFLQELGVYIFDDLKHAQVDPGLYQLLEALASDGVNLAIGSSAIRKAVNFRPETLGIKHFFSVIVCAEDATKHKPEPDIYLTAIERLHLPAQNCVVIEDAQAGVQSAKAAGIPVVSFGKYNEDPHQTLDADFHVADWPELTIQKLAGLTSGSTKRRAS